MNCVIEELFPTILVKSSNTGIDLKLLESRCDEYAKTRESVTRSNVNGRQYSDFRDDELYAIIRDSIPARSEKPIFGFDYFAWVNYNPPGSRNLRHQHNPYCGNFLSGVFYVKVPQNSGDIIFHDPRPHISGAPDQEYYYDAHPSLLYPSLEGDLLLFPSWLEHEVQENNSDEVRISISFNIFNLKF